MATTLKAAPVWVTLLNINSGEREKTAGLIILAVPSEIGPPSPDGSIYFHTIDSRVQLSYFQLTPDLPSNRVSINRFKTSASVSTFQCRNTPIRICKQSFWGLTNFGLRRTIDEPKRFNTVNNMVRFPLTMVARWSFTSHFGGGARIYPVRQTDVLSLF